jgi:uncharacterized protein (TIGR02646 family)
MIFVDRSRVPVPPILLSDRAKNAREKAEKYFYARRALRLQTRFNFDSSLWIQSADALASLFRNKCAYCESAYIRSSGSYLDHFRPKASAVGLSGELVKTYGEYGKELPDGYWWLANEWENLYYVCASCNRNKRNSFPVDGPRAKPGTTGKALLTEQPLLLDPCDEGTDSDPETFFYFDAEGHVAPKAVTNVNSASVRRAQITIEVLGLNRQDLTQQRKEVTQEVLSALKSIPLPTTQWIDNPLEKLLHPTKPYLALRRSLIREWAINGHTRLPDTLRVPFSSNLTQSLNQMSHLFSSPEAAKTSSAFASALAKPVAQQLKSAAPVIKVVKKVWEKISSEVGKPAPHVLGRGGYIQSIEIANFKAIEYFKIDIPSGSPDRVGWKVLLGENGTGKSSVLQAAALALLGEAASKYAYRSDRMLRKLPKKNGFADSGFVRVQLSSAPEPIEMHFTAKGITYGKGSALPVDLVLRGYGPTRLMPRPGRRRAPHRKTFNTESGPRNDAANLFDPFQPVCDPSAWLNRLESKEAFASVALSLKDLLRIPEKTWLHREKGSVIVPLDGLPITLDELSAGYESILVLAVDIMSAIHGTIHDMRHAAGIVLLDEIDAHLHPRWKMEIVNALRRSFPLIQFIATTHEPLCLRGLDDGEVTVMRRIGSQIVLEGNLPSPSGLRVDQLLTSHYFGLQSTLNPELDQKFMSYYALLAKHEQDLTPEQRASRDALKLELSGVGVLGHTRRDQLVYEAIDEYLAKESSQSIASRRELRAETKQRIAAILADLSNAGEASS